MKVLVIDDSSFIRRFTKGVLLNSNQFDEVVEMEDGGKGLEEIKNNPNKYDIVILDWNMPVMDGIDVLLEIRDLKISTPVIMCTSADKKENIINAISAGANEYLIKPFDATSLDTKVRKVIEAEEIRKKRSLEKRALVVDDSSTIRKVVSKILLDDGFFTDIVTADDGDTALKLFPKQKFDLVILDWEMPRIQGIDVLKTIRKTDKDTPIIMATGHTKIENMVEAFDSGASNFIPKPFTPQELIKKVYQQLMSK